MRRVYQVVPFLQEGDAIGDHARQLARVLGDAHAGYIVDRAGGALAGEAIRFDRARVGSGDLLVYHVAHASPIAGWLRTVRAEVIVDYHGITPPEFLRGWDAGLAGALARATSELADLARRAVLGIAHSGFTCSELDRAGFARTAALPILLEPGRLAVAPTAGQGAEAGASGDWLFVSRMAPNKRVEDVMKAFAVYRRAWCPGAQLHLVGRPDTETYDAALRRFADRLGIGGIHFAGRVSNAELAGHYRSAGLLVSMSEHEGFGVTLIEAMAAGLPVLAYAAGAVPETLGEAGILFRAKRYDEVAALAAEVVGDPALRARLAAAGKARAAAFAPEVIAPRWRELLAAGA